MELTELFQLIQSTLVKQGFKLSEHFRNSASCSWFVLGNELEKRKVTGIAEYSAIYGNTIEVRKCKHRNGAKADTSYYVAIEEWDRSSGRDYKKVKLMRSQTEPTLVKKITKLTLEYKDIVEEKRLNKIVEHYLNNM